MVTIRKSFILTLVAAALLIPLIFVALASADSHNPVHQIAGDYTVLSNAPAGAPRVENGVTMIAITADTELRGSTIGNATVEADCALGSGGAPTVCTGSLDFEGSLRGRIGSFKAIVDSWVAGGAAAYTSAHFVLVAGSGTGDLSNLVDFELNIQRDETVVLPDGELPVGIYFGTSRFEGDETPSANVQVVGDYSVISNAPSGALQSRME